VLIVTAALAGGLGACGSDSNSASTASADAEVAAVAGWTRIATTASYVVVVNVLPGEAMFTAAQIKAEHPAVAELALHGAINPVGVAVRHVEAHIYDRVTGLPNPDLHPTIVVVNRTTGERVEVPATLMQDVNIGVRDVHYGNNVAISAGGDLSLTIGIGTEGVTLDGHLD
jgi:hypothetical protein